MLGDTVDADGAAQPGAGADADDNSGIDDEDSVASPIKMAVGEPTTVSVKATNATFAPATLAGWLDLDGDGAFEANERVVVPVPPGTGTHQLTFPAGTASGTSTYARFRLFGGDVAAPSPTGSAAAGEVEDYRVSVLQPKLEISKESDAGTVSSQATRSPTR